MRSTFLRLRVHPLRFFQVSNLRLFEVKTSKNLNFRGEVEVSISEVFGRPSLNPVSASKSLEFPPAP